VEALLATLAGVILGGLAYALWRTVPTARDARRRGVPRSTALRWAVREIAQPGRYWWEERLALLRPAEAADVLAAEQTRLGVGHVTNVPCGLCGAEMVGVLTLDAGGALTARQESICAACGFRLDACRFCAHFQPLTRTALGGPGWGGLGQSDEGQGCCQRYRRWQPVEQVAPHLARKLEEMGYEGFNAPAHIQDSFVPLEECRAFAFDSKAWRARRAGIKNLDQRRAALVRLAQRDDPSTSSSQGTHRQGIWCSPRNCLAR